MAGVSDLVVASAQIKDGRLFIRNRRAFDMAVSQLCDRWELEVTVRRLRATRSPLQNSYYWGVVVQLLSEHTGYTPDETHEILKQMFVPKRLAVSDGNGMIHGEFVLGGSTREMNTIDFGEYMESIRQWAAEILNMVIPDPSEDEDAVQTHTKADPASRPIYYRARRRA